MPSTRNRTSAYLLLSAAAIALVVLGVGFL